MKKAYYIELILMDSLIHPLYQVFIMLQASVPLSLHDSFMKQLQGGRKRAKKYTPELRSFALTLDFYSPKAYDYVREIFKNVLPHRRTLQEWYASVDCEPGFSTEALQMLKRKTKSKNVVCALMLDEMHIRKNVQWDGSKYVGYADYSAGEKGKNEEAGTYAKEVLVFMLNGVNERWKVPVGYFFISSMGGEEKANLVNACLSFLNESGVKVVSLTFDGARTNFSMCRKLGASFKDPKNLKTWFLHPCTKERVYLFVDPPHALKLVRNTIGTYKIMYDADNKAIRWSYFEDLVKTQCEEKLHVGCRATNRHVNWKREKMRVKLAAQTLSESTARGMEYLREIQYSTESEKPEENIECSSGNENNVVREMVEWFMEYVKENENAGENETDEWNVSKIAEEIEEKCDTSTASDEARRNNVTEEVEIEENSKATENFFRTFNNIFDIMNSRNKYGKHYKKGLQSSNEEFIFSELIRVKSYILGLQESRNGRLIVEGERKTGFLGFLVCIESLILLYSEHVLTKKTLSYILMYKFCQDHLEVFFCAIRSRNGHNNNPSSIQFKAAYKRLLMHTAVKGTNGNCTELEETPLSILYASSTSKKNRAHFSNGHLSIPIAILNLRSSLKDCPDFDHNDLEEFENFLAERATIFQDHAVYALPAWSLSQYVHDVVGYISGFVVKTLRKRVLCSVCYEALTSQVTLSFLQEIKNYNSNNSNHGSGLVRASSDVIHLCKQAESVFREFELELPSKRHAMAFLILKTLNRLSKPLFNSLKSHSLDTAIGENHVYNVMKLILHKYFTIRLHYFASLLNERNIKLRIRNVSNKSVLFQNQ